MKRRWFAIKPAITLKGRKFKGIRGWAGKPFHPPLTDVPIGAYTLAAAFDVLSFVLGDREISSELHKAATYSLIAGLTVSVPTIVTGFWDWWKSTPPGTQAWRTANWHMAMMLLTTLLVVVNIWCRTKTDYDYTETGLAVLSAAIFGIMSFGATYGGGMVYDYAFNVEQDIDYAWEERETDVLPGKEKPVQDPT